MGWIQDIWHKITGWIRSLFKNVLAWITKAIEDVTVWFKVTRHKFNIWLAKALNTDLGFWVAIIGGVLFIGAYTLAVSSGLLTKIGIWIAALTQQLKSMTGSVLSYLHFSELYSIDKIVKILIPAYDHLWDAFYKAMGALSEEIGLGVGTITAFLRNSNTLILSTYTAMGFSLNEAEVIYMQQSNEFFKKVDSRFERYARNPEYIFKDINNEIVKPAVEQAGKNQFAVAKLLDKLSNSVTEIDDNISNVENNIKILIDDLPDEINIEITKRTDVFFKTIDDFHDEYITPTIDKINGVNNVFKEYQKTQAIQRDNWKILIDNPATFLMQIEALPDNLRAEQKRLLKQLLGSVDFTDIEKYNKQIIDGKINTNKSYGIKYESIFSGIDNRYPPVNLSVNIKALSSKIGSWFVGEY